MTTTPKTHTLANGVRVVCDPAAGYGTLALSVAAGRGSREEDAARNGWSHLLEHMVFKGAGPRSARELVEAIEGEGGQLNAATGHERTSFQVRALAGGAPLAMEVVSDLLLPARDRNPQSGPHGPGAYFVGSTSGVHLDPVIRTNRKNRKE